MFGRALAMEWVSRVIFLEAAICVAGNLSAYVSRGYPRQCIQTGYWGSLETTLLCVVWLQSGVESHIILHHEDTPYLFGPGIGVWHLKRDSEFLFIGS